MIRSILNTIILLPVLSYGQQNLVPNGSFEEHTQCPENISGINLALPWTNTGGGTTPDYFHACCPYEVVPPDTFPRLGVPESLFGFQFANTGEGYAGIYAYNGPVQEELREYLQVELVQPIYAGVRYRVSFYVSLADKFQHAVGTLGAYFTDAPVMNDNWHVYEVEPQIESPEGTVYNDKEHWTLIEDTFSSRYGGERFMLIGNFRKDSASNIVLVDSGSTLGHVQAYYFIDDVSVIALDSVPDGVEEHALDFSIYPNPATDVIRIEGVEQQWHLRLADLRGREVMTEEVSGHDHSLKIGHLPAGLYILEVTASDGRRATQRVVKMAGP